MHGARMTMYERSSLYVHVRLSGAAMSKCIIPLRISNGPQRRTRQMSPKAAAIWPQDALQSRKTQCCLRMHLTVNTYSYVSTSPTVKTHATQAVLLNGCSNSCKCCTSLCLLICKARPMAGANMLYCHSSQLWDVVPLPAGKTAKLQGMSE